MSITTFETAKVGDKVYSTVLGWGEIKRIKPRDTYPIHVSFTSTNGEVEIFTYKGYFYEHVPIQSLFWNEIVFEVPVKRKTKVVNGIEVPDISFEPNPGEYCYSPVPIHPDLYRHLYYCFNEANEHLKNNGLCYPCTEEGKSAAILHAKAMLKVN
jgi:hypothetical protein